ncbi:hypothetical protein D3C76_1404230 [compost metagenome]
MHAVCYVLTQFLSIMLADRVKLLRRGQRLLMMNIHCQRQGFMRVGLIFELLLFI